MIRLQDKFNADNLFSYRPLIGPTASQCHHLCQPELFRNMRSSRSIRPFFGFNLKQGHVHIDIESSATHNMSLLGRRGAGLAARGTTLAPSATASYLVRSFSALNRPPPKYPGHVPLTFLERGALAVGSAVGSLMNPRRAGKGLCPPFENHQPFMYL